MYCTNSCLLLEVHHMISARALVNEASLCRLIACEKHLFVGNCFWTQNIFNFSWISDTLLLFSLIYFLLTFSLALFYLMLLCAYAICELKSSSIYLCCLSHLVRYYLVHYHLIRYYLVRYHLVYYHFVLEPLKLTQFVTATKFQLVNVESRAWQWIILTWNPISVEICPPSDLTWTSLVSTKLPSHGIQRWPQGSPSGESMCPLLIQCPMHHLLANKLNKRCFKFSNIFSLDNERTNTIIIAY